MLYRVSRRFSFAYIYSVLYGTYRNWSTLELCFSFLFFKPRYHHLFDRKMTRCKKNGQEMLSREVLEIQRMIVFFVLVALLLF
jgi:hypothetical protein